MGFASGLGLTGEIFDLDALANAFLTEIAVEHPLRLVGCRRAAIRTERYADNYSAAAKIRQAVTQANRRLHFPRMLRRFGETGNQIGSRLHAERNDEIVVTNFFFFQRDFLASGIDAS